MISTVHVSQIRTQTYRGIPNCNELVADQEAAVQLCCSAVHDLRHVDSIVSGYVLVAYAPGDAEAQAFAALHQLQLHQS